MSLWTSVIFETYKQQHRNKVRGARARAEGAHRRLLGPARRARERAPRRGDVDAVAMKARAGLTAAHARALFETLPGDGDGMIDVDAFLETCDALRARAGARAAARRGGGRDAFGRRTKSFVAPTRFSRPSRPSRLSSPHARTSTERFRHAIGSFVRSSRFAFASRALAYFQTAVICARRRDAGAAPFTRSSTGWTARRVSVRAGDGRKTAAACLRADGVPKRTRDGTFVCASSGARGFVAAHGFDFVLALVSVASFLNPRAAGPAFFAENGAVSVLRLVSTDRRSGAA